MFRRFAICLAALAMTAVMTCHASTRPDADDSPWTSEDSTLEDGGNRLYNESQFSAAESLYRAALDRHPNSATALMFHVKALNALGLYDQALTESRRAVGLDPDNALAQEWLGMTLVLNHRNREAIDALRSSLALKPDDSTTLVWLGGAYLEDGQKAQGDLIFTTQMAAGDAETQAQTATLIADFFRQIGNGEMAIDWWKKSYALGNHDAARYLAWAYDGGAPGFPYDEGDSAYWSRRGPDDPYPWFPRLAQADQITGWAHGWGLVLIILASTFFLPWISVGIVAFFPARGLINEPSFPWMERARRAYPFMILLSFCVMLLPLVDLVSVLNYPGSLLPLPKWILAWITVAIGFWASNVVAVQWVRLYRADAGTAWDNMKDIGITLLLRGTIFLLFILMGISLPAQFGWRAALTIAATILAYFYIQFGGWIRLARLCRFLTPADAEMAHDAADLARAQGLPAPAVWIMPWRKANAFAFSFSNAIVATDKLRAILNRDEIRAVLAHELAHLCEDRGTRAMRLVVPLLLLPLCTLSLWQTSDFWFALGGCYLVFLTGVIILRKRARRMEERADTFGKAAESEAGIYPLALAKLYEANLIPAVLPGKGKVHPHLYDRLLAAGITPGFPRPRPPGRWGIWAAFLMLAIHGAVLMAIWLCLF